MVRNKYYKYLISQGNNSQIHSASMLKAQLKNILENCNKLNLIISILYFSIFKFNNAYERYNAPPKSMQNPNERRLSILKYKKKIKKFYTSKFLYLQLLDIIILNKFNLNLILPIKVVDSLQKNYRSVLSWIIIDRNTHD